MHKNQQLTSEQILAETYLEEIGFLNIPSDVIPSTSVLREFIGNSYFE